MKQIVIKTNGYDIPVFFLDNKAKKTLLFVHGFSSSYRFIGDLDKEKTNYNIVTFSFPGTQDVEAKEKVSINLFVSIVNDLINNHIKHSKIYLVGHSLGGLVCSEAGQNKKVKGVFFIAPVHPRIENGKLFSKLRVIVDPQTKKQELASKVITKSLSALNALTKKHSKTMDFISEDSPWYAIVKDTLMNKQYIDVTLRNNYHKLNRKARYIVGSLDEVISTSNFVKFVEEEMHKEVFSVISGHHPLSSKTSQVNEYINSYISYKKRFFTSKKSIID